MWQNARKNCSRSRSASMNVRWHCSTLSAEPLFDFLYGVDGLSPGRKLLAVFGLQEAPAADDAELGLPIIVAFPASPCLLEEAWRCRRTVLRLEDAAYSISTSCHLYRRRRAFLPSSILLLLLFSDIIKTFFQSVHHSAQAQRRSFCACSLPQAGCLSPDIV